MYTMKKAGSDFRENSPSFFYSRAFAVYTNTRFNHDTQACQAEYVIVCVGTNYKCDEFVHQLSTCLIFIQKAIRQHHTHLLPRLLLLF